MVIEEPQGLRARPRDFPSPRFSIIVLECDFSIQPPIDGFREGKMPWNWGPRPSSLFLSPLLSGLHFPCAILPPGRGLMGIRHQSQRWAWAKVADVANANCLVASSLKMRRRRPFTGQVRTCKQLPRCRGPYDEHDTGTAGSSLRNCIARVLGIDFEVRLRPILFLVSQRPTRAGLLPGRSHDRGRGARA
jgi:hypothetical protein